MIALSNHIKVLNVCWKGRVLWPREVAPNQALNLCTVTFGTEYILKMLPCYPQFQVFFNINCLLKLLWIECCKAQHIFSTEWLNHAPQFTNICTYKKLRVQRQQKDLLWKKILSLWRTPISRYDVFEQWWRIARAKPDWLDEWKMREFLVCHLWRTSARH